MSAPQPIAKNTVSLMAALVLQKAIAFIFFLILARRLGTIGTGQYVAAFSFSSFFGVFIDLGLASVLTRELARQRDKTQRYLSATLAIKLGLALMVYPALLLSVILLGWFQLGHPPFLLTAIAGLVMVFDSVTLTGASVFRGWRNLTLESFTIVINKVAMLAFGLLALWLWRSPMSVAAAIFLASLLSVSIIIFGLRKGAIRPLALTWDVQTNRELFRLAVPFAAATIFSTAYAQVDSILLSVLKGDDAVGLYSVAAKTMNAFAFIPSAFAAALYPAMSADFARGGQKLDVLLREGMKYLLIIAAPVSVGLTLYADTFVQLISPDYASAAPAVRLLMPSLIFVFLSFPLGSLLNATNHASWQTMTIVAGTIVNILLNIFLIPNFSYVGSSIAWLTTNIVITATGFILVYRVLPYRLGPFLASVGRVAVATLLMAWFVISFQATLWMPVVIILAGIIYAISLLISREVSLTEIRDTVRLLRFKNEFPETIE